jgi:hypothetical protein
MTRGLARRTRLPAITITQLTLEALAIGAIASRVAAA